MLTAISVTERAIQAFSQPALVQATIGVIATVVLTLTVARLISDTTRRLLARASVDSTITLLIGRILLYAILAIGALLVLSQLGFNETGLVPVLGVMGLAISLSLQDVFKNFFSGLYLLVEHPFRIGDYISAQGVEGVVESVELRVTVLRTDHGQRILIPNALVFANVVINHTAYNMHHSVLKMTMPLTGLDPEQTARDIGTLVMAVPGVRAQPPAEVSVITMGQDTVVYQIQYWADASSVPGNAVAIRLRHAYTQASIEVS